MTPSLEQLSENILSQIDNGHTVIKNCSNGFMIVECKDDRVFNVQEIMDNHMAMKKLANGEKKLVLTLAGKNTSINKDARKYLSLGLHSEYTKAEAFVLQSAMQHMLAIVYVSLRRPAVPTNYFSKVNKALDWLQKIDGK